MKIIRTAFIVAFLFATSQQALANATLAVFPLLDITQDSNGVNLQLTEYVRQQVEKLGYPLVPSDDIMTFMVVHRIRSLGKLDNIQLERVRKELGAQYVMMGTVFQLNSGPAAELSLSLQIVSTVDKQTVWTTTKDLHLSELKTLLAISDAKTIDDLFGTFFPALFAEDFPELEIEAGEYQQGLDIKSVALSSSYLRSAEKITCRIQFHRESFEESGTDSYQFSLQAGEKEIPALFDAEDRLVSATWQVQDDEGLYKVVLHARQNGREGQKFVVGEYYVDNAPPSFDIILAGHEIDGKLMTSGETNIFVTTKEPEPITRWASEIIDTENFPVVYHEYPGQLPKKMSWTGFGSDGKRVPDGEYIIKLTAWDRAGLKGSAEKMISLRNEPPEITLHVEAEKNSLLLSLDNAISTPLLLWSAKFYKDGVVPVKAVDGDTLPASIVLELEEFPEDASLELVVEARDLLGNKKKERFKNVFALLKKDENPESEQVESQWLEEF